MNASVTVYYSVPYAYASRFEAPKAIETKEDMSASQTVNATTHGPVCVNFGLPPPIDKGFGVLLGPTPPQPQQEDCLNLDIYVPDGGHNDLPVLFFAPGGAYLVGGSYPYDMRSLVTRSAAKGKPFIAVVVNYRLGPLGVLNPSTNEDDCNLSILDQIEALRYVRKYVGAFGGDASKVTISKRASTSLSKLPY